MNKPSLVSALALALFANASLADCSKVKKVNPKTINSTIDCLNSENAAQASDLKSLHDKTGSFRSDIPDLQTQVDTLRSQIGDTSSFQAAIEQLQADVKALQGIPPVTPIGTFENDYLKAQALGVTKIFSSQDGTAYISATVQIENKSAGTLYLAYDYTKGFTAVDDHGISANNYQYPNSGINGVFGNSETLSRSSFSVLSPGSVMSVGLTTNTVEKDQAAKLGNRFNLTFTVVRYLEPNLEQGKFDTATIGFAGITATQ